MSRPARSAKTTGRPRAFDVRAVIAAAQDAFSEHGPELTSVVDLEERTGIDRSSLYNTFGSKHALFDAALRNYLEVGIEARLHKLRQPNAHLSTLAAFFISMAQTFRSYPELAERGCMMVNAVAELGPRDSRTALAGAYRDAFRSAFLTALRQAAERGEIDPKRLQARAKVLASLTMGLFVTARIDPSDAAEVCEDVAAEVRSWKLG
jgi:AcrR family transcriptional regulator